MKRISGLSLAAFLLGGSAYAWGAETQQQAPKSQEVECHPVSEIKDLLEGKIITILTLGQVHFAQGVYALDPSTEGMPPGDGAMLVEFDKKVQGHKLRVGFIIWTKDGGKTACSPVIGPYGPGVLIPLHKVTTNKGEESVDPSGPQPGDLKL